ncbi:MAG TPA: SDR family NAD(P)-dependent oxidoreductase [Sphingobium sp.]|nr:SDR family NAD(P)-dependent oxidoreductase [Sphingobium sp.]
MIEQFRDQVVVVTGGSRGIGARLVRRLARAGAKVVFGARRLDILSGIEAELIAEGCDVKAVACDLAVPDQCSALVGAALSHYGTVDVLVNNAGISGVQNPDGKSPMPRWMR